MYKSLIKWFGELHVGTQQLIVLLALSLIPIIIILFSIYGLFYRSMKEQTIRSVSNTLSQVSFEMDMVASSLESTSTTLAFTERVQDYLLDVGRGKKISHANLFGVDQSISNFFNGKLMRSIVLVDTKGNMTQFPKHLSEQSLNVIEEHKNDEFYHRPIWIFDNTTNLIHVLRPVESVRNYSRIGFLDICAYPEMFKRQFAALDFGNNGWIAVLDGKGNLVTSTMGKTHIEIFDVRELQQKEKNSHYAQGRYLFFTDSSSVMGWTVVGCILKSSVFGGISRLLFIICALGVLMIALSLIISHRFSRFSASRIGRLSSAMEQFSKGDLNTRIEPDNNPEFRDIGLHFNDMVRQINNLIDEEYRIKLLQNQTELKMLQAQIHPHFLYNTLNVMYWKAQIGQQDDLARMTLALADIFRTSIDKTHDFILLEEELKHVQDYLFIQQMRYGSRITVRIDVPSRLYQYTLPKLIFQPVVENAFEHGLALKRGQGNILISVEENEEDLLFKISDDGVGMDEQTVESLLVESEGKGYQALVNVHKRLQLLYGEPYGIQISSRNNEGTVVTMRIKKEKSINVQCLDS